MTSLKTFMPGLGEVAPAPARPLTIPVDFAVVAVAGERGVRTSKRDAGHGSANERTDFQAVLFSGKCSTFGVNHASIRAITCSPVRK